MPFEERSIERASRFITSVGSIITCSAEDLIVHKAFAGRDRDWADIQGILGRHKKDLNIAQIEEELQPLLELKEDYEAVPKLRKMLAST